MGFFNKLNEPVFLKENSDSQEQLEKLKSLETFLNDEGKRIIQQDIKNIEYGIVGENNIAYELKNSHLPLYVLHDIYLEMDDFSAQIDYMVFTRKICFIIECKNLYGNIEINSNGDFIRTSEYNGKRKKEGIYSPITQNQRHLELMKKIIVESRSNVFTKLIIKNAFDNLYKSVVVLANPKTVVNMKYAQKDIKRKVIRADQLIGYIKDIYNESKEPAINDNELLNWAQKILNMHNNITKDYLKKYDQYKIDEILAVEKDVEVNMSNIEDTNIYKELKAFRYNKSKEENIKPYFIFNNKQLEDLIEKMPTTKEDLMIVSGFGEVKVLKYGEDIIEIIKKHI
ncbi:MAG: NERD domain-containing protein [Coprobacillus sp.]